MSNLHIDGLVFPASSVVTKSLSSSMLCVYPWFKELRGIEVLLKVSEDACGCYTLGLIDSCGFGLISVLYHSHRFNSKAQGKSHREQRKTTYRGCPRKFSLQTLRYTVESLAGRPFN